MHSRSARQTLRPPQPPPQEEDEADFNQRFPDHFAAFADVAGEEPADHDTPPAHPPPGTDGADGAAASEAEAKTAAARALLEGDILEELVALHAQLFAALAARAGAPGADAGAAAAGAGAATGRTFELCYGLGAQLAAAQGALLPAGVDAAARGGHLMRIAGEHAALGSAAASTSAAAVAAAAAAAAVAAGGDRSGREDDAGAAAAEAAGASVDLQRPFVEETALMQGPVSAVAARCAGLLEEWPEHPLLTQLTAICERLLALPVTAPLKTALTGLELLLARAQVGTGAGSIRRAVPQSLVSAAHTP
jgi:midasin